MIEPAFCDGKYPSLILASRRIHGTKALFGILVPEVVRAVRSCRQECAVRRVKA